MKKFDFSGVWVVAELGVRAEVGVIMLGSAGEAEIIVRKLREADSPALRLEELQERTRLSRATIHDNLERLRKANKVEVTEDGHGTVWVSSHNR